MFGGEFFSFRGEGKGGKCLEKETEASIMEKEKFLRTGGRVHGSTRGPCGPKKLARNLGQR